MRGYVNRLPLLLVIALLAVFASGQRGYERYRVWVPDQRAAQMLADSSVALFSCRIRIGETDVIVEPGQIGALHALGLVYRRVGALPALDPYSLHRPEGAPGDYLAEYLRYSEVLTVMESWRAQWPSLIDREQIGQSIQGRPIWAYRLRNPNTTQEGSIVFHGGIHAREWISVPVSMYMFERSLREALAGPEGWERISRLEISLIPVLNPDGYEYSWTNNRLWRKNRRNNGNGTFGVDLNRNYSIAWGGIGSSGNTSSQTYRGTAPFSEPETQAIRDYLDSRHNLLAFIDYHSYGQYVLWPTGYATWPAPDYAMLKSFGDTYRDGILQAGGLSYVSGQAAIVLSPAGGCSDDYGYETFGIPSYTVELRDRGASGFVLPPSQILPTALENWGGFKLFVRQLMSE